MRRTSLALAQAGRGQPKTAMLFSIELLLLQNVDLPSLRVRLRKCYAIKLHILEKPNSKFSIIRENAHSRKAIKRFPPLAPPFLDLPYTQVWV